MDLSTCYCRHRFCDRYGQSGKNARLESAGWHEGARRLKCLDCGHRCSSRAGTAYAGIRTPEEVYRKGIHHLAEGVSIRTTALLMECDKDTVCHWLPGIGRHCRRVLDYFFRALHLTECQLDELWTFVYKKEKHLTALEKLARRYGDAWIWTAFDPIRKLVPAWRVGKRTLSDAQKFIKSLKSKHDSHLPFFMLRMMICLIMPTPSLRFMVRPIRHRGREREGGYLFHANVHRLICLRRGYQRARGESGRAGDDPLDLWNGRTTRYLLENIAGEYRD